MAMRSGIGYVVMKKLIIIAILLLAGTANAALLTGKTPANYGSLPSGWSLVRANMLPGRYL
jgi:hypothetical protein